ncbi:MAG: hypothetical protein Fur0024_2630 [Patescibacteria group bacterium]
MKKILIAFFFGILFISFAPIFSSAEDNQDIFSGNINFSNPIIYAPTGKSCYGLAFKSNSLDLHLQVEENIVHFEEEVYGNSEEILQTKFFSNFIMLKKPKESVEVLFFEENFSGKTLEFFCFTKEKTKENFWEWIKNLKPKISSIETANAQSEIEIIKRESWLKPNLEVKEGEKDQNGRELFWPIEKYPKLQIFVHHTVSANFDSNPIETLNGIYQYHARARLDPDDNSSGWGDIGYNFIIDQQGRIYEGRKGGIWAMGAHVLGYNSRSIGIALMGDYSLSIDPPQAQLDSLKKLTNYISKETGMDLSAQIVRDGTIFNAISGHRDGQATSCPGERLYNKLPQIRAESFISTNRARFAGIETAENHQPMRFVPTEKKWIKIKYKNISNEVWTKGTPTEVKLKNLSNELETKYFLPENFETSQIENSVSPNGIATFYAELVAPFKFGKFQIPFKLEKVNGDRVFVDYSEVSEAEVFMPNLSIQSVSVSPEKTSYTPGEEVIINFSYKNTSGYSLGITGEKVRIGTSYPKDRTSAFYDISWISTNRPTEISKIIYPNEFWNGSFKLKIPNSPGNFVEWFTPVSEGNFWFPDSAKFAIGINVSTLTPITTNGLTSFLYSDKNFGEHFATAVNQNPNKIWRNTSPPHSRINSTGFSIKYFGFLKIETEKNYNIKMFANDRNTLWINGSPIFESEKGEDLEADIFLKSGFHKILIEHSQDFIDGNLQIFLDGTQLSNNQLFSNVNLVNGLVKQNFFEGENFSANFGASMKKSSPNLPRTLSAQHIFARPDNFVMQEIFIYFFESSGEYQIRANADDKIKVWIDDPLVINSWKSSTGSDIIGKINLSAGFHQVVVNYGEISGDSALSLQIKSPNSTTFSDFKKENIFSQTYEFDPIFKNGMESCFYSNTNFSIDSKIFCDAFLNFNSNQDFSTNPTISGYFEKTAISNSFPRILPPENFGIKAKGVVDFVNQTTNPLDSPTNFEIKVGSDDGIKLTNGNGKFYDKFFPKSFSEETINFPTDNFSSNLEFQYFQLRWDAILKLELKNVKIYFA